MHEDQFTIEELAIQAAEFCEEAALNPEENRHETWQYAMDRADELRSYFVYDAKPESILERHRPKEDPEVSEYRKDAYENIGYSFVRRVLNYLQRLFHPSLFELSFTDRDIQTNRLEQGESLRDYLTHSLPVYGSITSFLRNFAMEKMFSDPNGFVVLMTDRSDSQLLEDFGAQALPQPIPQFVPTDNAYLCEDTLVVYSSQKSEIKEKADSEEFVKDGNVFFVFTPDITFRVYQVGVRKDNEYETEVWNFHDFGRPLFEQLGGIPTPHGEGVLSLSPTVAYDSHIQPAIPYLNKMISLDSEQSASYLMHIFLQKWEEEVPCKQCEGEGYRMVDIAHGIGTIRERCDDCKGTGAANAGTTFKRMFVARGDDGKLDPTDPAGYISIPTDIIEIVETKLQLLNTQGLEALNMGFLKKRETSQVESAESKREEKDALNTFLETIMKDINRIANFVGSGINHLRYGAMLGTAIGENVPSIKAPSNFNLESPVESAEYIKLLNESKAPSCFVKEVLKQNASQRFGLGTEKEKKVHVALDLDPLFNLVGEDISDLRQAGASITPTEMNIHTYMTELIAQAIEENEGFLDLPLSEQRDIISELAQAYEPEPIEEDIKSEEVILS